MNVENERLVTHSTELAQGNTLTFDVRLMGPLDISTSLELFRRNGDDLLDRWDGVTLMRTLPVESGSVAFACTIGGTIDEPLLHVTVDEPIWRLHVESALHMVFIQPPAEFVELLQSDPVIADLAQRYRGLRPLLQLDLLAALVRSISAQQINLRWATVIRRRLAEAYGDQHSINGQQVYSLNPHRLAAADPADIRALQFTTRKAEYIIGIAKAIVSGTLSLEVLAMLPDEEVIARLIALHGIGRWTAEWLLARTLGRPCVVAGDLSVRKAVGRAYLGQDLPSEREVRAATRHWGLSANIAQTLLLHDLSVSLAHKNELDADRP